MSVTLSRYVLFVLLAGSASASTVSLAEAIVLTPQAGDTAEDVAIRKWQTQAQTGAGTEAAFERLAWAYIDKARRSSDSGYYKLAEETANASEARFGQSDQTRLIRGHVFHNLHRFQEAESIARDLTHRRREPIDLALLTDVLMEQGKVDEAVEVLQRFVNLKPGAEAYSRIAHLRWIKGDLAGAIDAMVSAVGMSGPAQPAIHAWLLTRLSGFYLQQGDPSRANQAANAALQTAPDFAPALLARGKAALAGGDTPGAIDTLQHAAQLNPLPEYQWWLSDALRAVGRTADANAMDALIVQQGPRTDPRTTALFLATRGDQAGTAVTLASAERLSRRDVFTHDAMAWALDAHGETKRAQQEITRALAENTKDARLLLHAGLIAQHRGEVASAMAYLAEATPLALTLTPSERALLAAASDASSRVASLQPLSPAE